MKRRSFLTGLIAAPAILDSTGIFRGAVDIFVPRQLTRRKEIAVIQIYAAALSQQRAIQGQVLKSGSDGATRLAKRIALDDLEKNTKNAVMNVYLSDGFTKEEVIQRYGWT